MKKQWSLVALGEVITHNKEYIEEPEPKIYPKLSVKLYGRGVVLDDSADGSLLRMKKHQIAKNGQVILSEIWGKKGAIGFVPPEGDGALCTSHFFLFDVNYEKLEPKYLQAIFIANYLQNQLDAEAKGTTGYAAVRPKHLLSAKIPLPPLDEQRRIVARIEELAAKVEEARGLRRQSIEENQLIIKASLQKFFSPTIGSIELGKVSTVIDPNPSHRYPIYIEDGVPIISTVDFVGEDAISTVKARRVPLSFYEDTLGRFGVGEGDVIFSRKGKIGYARLHPANIKLAMTHTLCVIQPEQNKLLPKYLLYYTKSSAFIDYLMGIMNPNSGVPTLGLGVIRSAPFNLPPLEEQHRIVAYLDNLQSKVDALKRLQAETAAELDALLPSILDKAFKGEL
jgi:type I restriction enzyme S subunit